MRSLTSHIRCRPGISLIELIVGIGIFVTIVTSAVVLVIGSYDTNLRDDDRLKSDMYLQQGIEAVRAMRTYDPESVATNGTYGLSRAGGYFVFSGSSETLGKFTRTITVAGLLRNIGCDIVASGGITDPNSKKITVNVSWVQSSGITASTSAVEYLQDWRKPIVQQGCGQAGYFAIDSNLATLSGTGPAGKQIDKLLFSNLSDVPITITKIRPSWIGGDDDAEMIELDTNNGFAPNFSTVLWKSSGVGTPTGGQHSGTELDIVDYTFPPNAPFPTDNTKVIRLDEVMTGAEFTFVYTMLDGSTATVIFTPH